MTEFKAGKYGKESEYSYAFGFFPVFELLKYRPGEVLRVVLSSKAKASGGAEKLSGICAAKNIRISTDDKLLSRISPKENVFAAGIFRKYSSPIQKSGAQLVLNCPENAGNLGTIIRTMIGFNACDIALIRPAVDIFDPACVRASMGGLFQVNFSYFDSFEGYLREHPKRNIYLFMTSGEKSVREAEFVKPCSLVFGSESSGLPEEFRKHGRSVYIPQSDRIDSLNISVAAGIGLYEAAKNFTENE